MEDFGLYVIITDPDYPVSKITELCVKYRVGMLQLREKDVCDKKLLKTLEIMLSITKGSATKVIINDRVDLAIASGVDGYHLGQDDLPLSNAREVAGNRNLVCGLSTHSLEQAEEAIKLKPDYIGFGPVYPTFAKKNPDAPVGCDQLKQVLALSECPVVAIGGINRDNINEVLETGAKNIAMIKGLVKSANIEEEISFYSSLLAR
ncbi:MAG: thiamine phosphate synthase [Spirochaetes bacterium]|nr:thiamine phosphate synthase [Spirochaetota bacterium]MBN2771220.1 thiamine phosphate synthase [Spirochaetota bacterium]